MPVMDGLKLTYEIRKDHDKNSLAILAVSSNKDNEVNTLFLKTGVILMAMTIFSLILARGALLIFQAKIGILSASLIAGVFGYLWLRFYSPRT